MKHKTLKRITTLCLASALCMGMGTVAFASEVSDVDANNAMALVLNADTNEAFSFESSLTDIAVNTGSLEMKVLKNNLNTVELNIPNMDKTFEVNFLPMDTILVGVQDNIVEYTSEDGTLSSFLIAQERSSKMVSIIKNETAPHSFWYEFSIPTDASIDYARHEYTGEILNGTLNIYEENGERLGAVNAPKVVDADGLEVESYFEITGNNVRHIILPTEDTTYPLISSVWIAPVYDNVNSNARAAAIFTYFTSPTIKYNYAGDGLHAFSLGGRTWNEDTRHIDETPAWNATKSYYKNISLWTNEESLYNQFVCHSNLAQRKDPWNIEPHRPAVGLLKFEACFCNYPDCWWD